MSEHAVLIREVEHILHHPNADKLDIVKLYGLNYTIISQRDSYEVGDLAVFFPDSLILPQSLVDYFELTYLKNNMVKPTKIRGIVSQALILPFSDFVQVEDDNATVYNIFNDMFFEWMEYKLDLNHDYSTTLGVTRKEDVVNGDTGKTKGNLPFGVEKYDLESPIRFPFLFEQLLDEEVMITEKLEGTNFAIHITKNDVVIDFQYCSRNLIKEGGLYQEIPQKEGVNLFAEWLLNKTKAESVTIRGEIIGQGIQGNIYKLNNQQCYVFDIKVDGEYVSAMQCFQYIDDYNDYSKQKIKHAPIVYFGVLSNYAKDVEGLKGKSNGNSILNDKVMREGIVVKSYCNPRIIFKVRSPEYLAQ